MKLTKDTERMAGTKVRVRLGWGEEENLPKKPNLNVISRYPDVNRATDHHHLYTRVDEETNQVCVYYFQLL